MSAKLSNIWNYSQPDFYHFSEDSILLANYVAQSCACTPNDKLIGLDLMSGSGIIGFEIIQKTNRFSHFDFVELQERYKPHFKLNQEQLNSKFDVVTNGYFKSIDQFRSSLIYDVVVCNPPYYHLSKKQHPKKVERRLAMMGAESLWDTLFLLLKNTLYWKRAYFVLKADVWLHFRASSFLNECEYKAEELAEDLWVLTIFSLNKKID